LAGKEFDTRTASDIIYGKFWILIKEDQFFTMIINKQCTKMPWNSLPDDLQYPAVD